MDKIISLNKISNIIKPNTATIVGGGFDLFHIGHLKYLEKCSKISRPLIVIIQSDKQLRYRKGENRPVVKQSHRAKIISSLSFVDYVLILPMPTYYEKYIKIIKPRHIIFSKENLKFRLYKQREIEKKFPKIKVIFINKVKNISTTNIINNILTNHNFQIIKDPIKKILYTLNTKNKINIGQTSALLMSNNGIKVGATNTEKNHAEEIVINEALQKGINLEKCKLYISICPCILCSKLIIKNKIPEVYYLNKLGLAEGIKLLKQNNIKVSKY